MGILENLMAGILNKAEITLKQKLSPSLWHNRLKTESTAKLDYVPGHFSRGTKTILLFLL